MLNALELDDDNDGIPDHMDDNEYSDVEYEMDMHDKDTDGDGIPDKDDPDIDGDGIPNTIHTDHDGDGILDNVFFNALGVLSIPLIKINYGFVSWVG